MLVLEEANERYKEHPLLAIREATRKVETAELVRDCLINRAIQEGKISLQSIGKYANMSRQAIHYRKKALNG